MSSLTPHGSPCLPMHELLAQAFDTLIERLMALGFHSLPTIGIVPFEGDSDIFGHMFSGHVKAGVVLMSVNTERCASAARGNREILAKELLVTLGHEFAHSVAIVIDLHEETHQGPLNEALQWDRVFPDEEDFAEIFGICLMENSFKDYPFWRLFIPEMVKVYQAFIDSLSPRALTTVSE